MSNPTVVLPAAVQLIGEALDKLYSAELALRAGVLALARTSAGSQALLERFREHQRLCGHLYGEVKGDRFALQRELIHCRGASVVEVARAAKELLEGACDCGLGDFAAPELHPAGCASLRGRA